VSTLAFIAKLDAPALAYVGTYGLQNPRARVWGLIFTAPPTKFQWNSYRKQHQTLFSLWIHERNTREFGILFKFVTQATKISLAHAFLISKKKRFGVEGAVVTGLSHQRWDQEVRDLLEGVYFFRSTMIQHPPFNHSQWFGRFFREHLPTSISSIPWLSWSSHINNVHYSWSSRTSGRIHIIYFLSQI